MIIVAVLVVRAKAAAGSLEVVAVVTAASTGALQGVLIVQIEVVREGVVSRARRRPLLLFQFLLKIGKITM